MPGPTDLIYSETTAGTGSGATATHAAGASGTTHICRHISGHTDADATITIESPASTVKAQWTIDVSVNGNSFAINIPDGILGTKNAAILGKISASTTDCQVQISGYTRANL